MTGRYLAEEKVEWRHPADSPPPLGTKLLIYMWPGGTTVIGDWQHSGGALWAPLLKVPAELKQRLEEEWKPR